MTCLDDAFFEDLLKKSKVVKNILVIAAVID